MTIEAPKAPVRPALSDSKRALLEKRLLGKKATTTTPIHRIPPRATDGDAPLSYAQQRMWFLHELSPESGAYTVYIGWSLEGTVVVEGVHHALNQVVARHEILRTLYTVVEEQSVQRILPVVEVPLPMTDLTHLPLSEREAEAQRLALIELPQPFNLKETIPLRARLFRLTDHCYWFVLAIHHIASDAWSARCFTQDFEVAYNAFLEGNREPLPPLPVQYADFAEWQRGWLAESGKVEQQLEYWRNQLAELPPLLELPTDHPRLAVLRDQTATVPITFSAVQSQHIRSVSHRYQVTPFMTLLALFQIVLHRYSQQADIAVGTPVANRPRPELEGLIGLFINTVVLRTRFTPTLTVRDLLTQVRETLLNAYANQELPFEKLVEALNPERTLSYTPLFQVQFVYHNVADEVPRLHGVVAAELPFTYQTNKFDLTLVLKERDGEIVGEMGYNTDLFDEATVKRMVSAYQQVVEVALTAPDMKVARLPMLDVETKYQLLSTWNETERWVEDRHFHERIAQQAAQTPDRIALACEGQTLTYEALERRANQLAHALQAHGVGPDQRVALFADRSIEFVVGLVGIAKAGGAYVPIDPISPSGRVGYMVTETEAVVMLTQRHLQAELPPLACEQWLLDEPTRFEAYPVTPPVSGVEGENLAYILFTSGSTGRPKGVAVEHRQLNDYIEGILERMAFPEGASYAIVSTMAADLGNTVLFPSLCTGGTLHILPYERSTDPLAFAEYFAHHRIDCLKIVPSHFEALLTAPDPIQVVPHQRLIFGGEASRWETIARIQALRPDCQIFNHYGPTETTVGVLTYPVPLRPTAEDGSTLPLGRPLPNARMYIVDRQGEPLPVGVPGELYIGGDGVTRGYLNHPALTAERFVPDPFSTIPGARLYKTGDLTRYRANGTLEFLGRTDHQVKIRGYRIELGEIEALLLQQSTVREAILMVHEDNDHDKRLVAYVVPVAEQIAASTFAQELRGVLRAQLPDYMVPAHIMVLEALPLTPNGKIDRHALPAPEFTPRTTDGDFIAPRTPQEQEVAAIWQEVLGIPAISIDDNFFDVGGDSFKAIRVVRKMGASVSVMMLFKYPTIRALAHALTAETPAGQHTLLHRLTKAHRAVTPALSLVCVPYGGASAVSYQPLADAMPTNVALYAVELPGHDFSRPDEAPESIETVAERVLGEIQQSITGPFSLYGHCVGSALTVEIARRVEAAGLPLQTVYLAGSFPAPRLPGKVFEFFANLFSQDRMVADRVYRDFLKGLGGFQESLEPDELAFVMRNLRHDFNHAEAYFTKANLTPDDQMVKLHTPVVCIAGEKDRSTEFYEERVSEWEHFAKSVNLAVVRRAGHFFLKHQAGAIARIISAQETLLGSSESPTVAAPRHQAHRDDPPPSLARFGVVAIGQLISMIGTALTSFALGIWTYQQTGQVSDFALISLFALLPGILMLPIAGAVVDRIDRRKVMMGADLAAGLRTLVLAGLFFSGQLEMWHIYIAAIIGSLCGTFQRPAYVAAIAQLVPKRYLGHANGIAELGTATGTSIAPLLAGALIGTVGLTGVLLFDFVSFLCAITMLSLVRFPNSMFRKREEPLVQEIVNGWRYVTERRGLVAMVIFFCASNLLLAMMTVLVTPLGLKLGSVTEMGTAMAMGESGLIAGSLLMGIWGGTARRAEGMILFVAIEGIFMMLMGAYPSLLLLALGLFGFNLCLAISNGHWQALIQTQVPFQLHGRVFAMNQMLAWSMMPLGYLMAGPLNDNLFEPLLAVNGVLSQSIGLLMGVGDGRGMGLFLLVIGVLTMVIGYLGYRYRPLRYMEEEMENPYTDTLLAKDVDPATLVIFQPLRS